MKNYLSFQKKQESFNSKFNFICVSLIVLCTACTKQPVKNTGNEVARGNKLITTALGANESFVIANQSGELWCTFKYNNVAKFDFMVGGAGAISQLRWSAASNAPLLSPTYAGEHTDRVIQTTWWSDNILCNINSQAEKRWNVTQAGDGAGVLSPTNTVIVDQTNHSVDVYADVQDQFTPAYNSTLHGGFKMLTRYTCLAGGVIEIRRVMIAKQADSAGVNKPYTHLYVEGWTPFLSASSTFNALALSLDTAGAPNWWYLADYNIPTYPNWDADETNGYAVAYHTNTATSNVYAAFVFGNEQPNASFSGRHAFNSMNWNNGIGVLPGLTFASFPVGGIIDQHFYLYVSSGRNGATMTLLNSLVSQLPSVKTYGPSDTKPTDLATIVSNINTYTSTSGTRTENLGSLASGL
ncbi:MAG: hypothetical protein EOP47_19665 [Sphingobacteriaceae bacterium]|nr:MAG: hypothetical protein EOP47_19665 [Sphingobacteriaceae bacterium]